MPTESHQPKDIAMFFDELYLGEPRYWWREDTRYSTNPADHPTSLLAQGTLRKLHRGQAQQAARRRRGLSTLARVRAQTPSGWLCSDTAWTQ
jgi:hypothetical protein